MSDELDEHAHHNHKQFKLRVVKDNIDQQGVLTFCPVHKAAHFKLDIVFPEGDVTPLAHHEHAYDLEANDKTIDEVIAMHRTDMENFYFVKEARSIIAALKDTIKNSNYHQKGKTDNEPPDPFKRQTSL